MRLKGRRAIVTGATSGIGRGVAKVLASEGAAVVVTGRSKERGEETVAAIEADDGRAWFVPCDVTKQVQIARLVRRADQLMGGIDTLVNCAGISVRRDIVSIPVEDLDDVLAVNLRGLMLVTKHVLPHLQRAGEGSILNVSSPHSEESSPNEAVYAAAKGGVDAFSRSTAIDFAPNIRVNIIHPGWIDTKLSREIFKSLSSADDGGASARRVIAAEQPMRRIGTPEDVGRAAAFLSSRDAAFITGATLAVDGGLLALLERWTSEKVARIDATSH